MTFIPLKSNALQGSSFARYEWSARIPNDTLLEDILKPAWWVHWAHMLKPMQRVELVTEDFLLDLEVRVTRVADGLVYVRPLRISEDTAGRALLSAAREKQAEAKAADAAAEIEMPEGYKLGYSPANGYFVVLRANNKTLKTGFTTKGDAASWASEHASTANAIAA